MLMILTPNKNKIAGVGIPHHENVAVAARPLYLYTGILGLQAYNTLNAMACEKTF
jgi:hypothetical protein